MTGFDSKRQAALDKLVEIQEELRMYDDQKQGVLMTKDREALKLALEALKYHTTQTRPIHQTDEAIAAIEAVLTPPTQEPACPSCGNNRQVWTNQITGRKTCHRFGCTWPQPAQEPRNFCSRCGKRTADLTVIHTCTPPRGLEMT
jgi:uncharacterized protein with PIN domain